MIIITAWPSSWEQLLCRDARALGIVLEFLRLSETPVDDIATALAFLSAACGQGHTVCATVIHTGFRHCTYTLSIP